MSSTPFYQKAFSSEHIQDRPLSFEDCVHQHTLHAFAQFKKVTNRYAWFHIGFFILGCMELLAFALFFSFLTQSTILAFSLAGIFLTGFSYSVILFYLQAKKPEQLVEIRQLFLRFFQENTPLPKGSLEYHLALSHALYHFFHYLDRKEYTYYTLPALFKTLAPLIQKFSVWCHWKDRHQMQEFLLLMIIREHIDMVKIAPTDFETHSGLGQAYTLLSKHYRDPRLMDPDTLHLWISPEYHTPEMQTKFERAARKAIEEYRILDEYAPNDPWVQAQLGAIFHDLDMIPEEIQAYETLLSLSPQEPHVLLRLGILYFQQGRNAHALRIYEQLKEENSEQAQQLLLHYDS